MAIKLLQRVVWNTSGWRRPTAATNEGGYFQENGFGHEEWNFQTDDAVDGDVLGYAYWTPSQKALRVSEGEFDIGFWAIHPESRRRLLVGRYANARLADEAFQMRTVRHFEDEGIFKRRADELQAVVPGMTLVKATKSAREGYEEGWMRFRCAAGAVHAFEPSAYVEVPSRIRDTGLSLRFASPTFVDAFPTPPSKATDEYGRTAALAEDAYFREVGARLHVIVPLHNALSNAFAKWLKAEGFHRIRQEAFRVDAEFCFGEYLHRAELKTCHGVGTTKAIREALGQLLEYNHYGIRTTATRWWVVLDTKPTPTDLAFIQTLRVARQLPLVLGWQVGATFETDVDVTES